MDAALDVHCAMQNGFELNQSGSHTLQDRAFEGTDALRDRLIEATVEAIADGSGPRLVRSRL